MAETFFREAGEGPGVICLHSNAASSAQWRALMEALAPRHRVIAPDLHGHGKGPAWRDGLRLADEAALVEPLIARAGAPVALVGHSYGAAVALVTALAQRDRVRALVLYEPTLFAIVEDRDEVGGIAGAVSRAAAALARGDGDGAAREFIDFWMGDGAWARTPEARKPAIVETVRQVQGWADALFGEPTPPSAFATLEMPVLLMTGSASPRSAHAVAERLAHVLPRVECQAFDGLGHMGPLTHPEPVNAAIADFLART